MSDNQNENALRIAAYIGNRLSPEEREAFKRALSEDDELRVQYVDALMNRAGTAPGASRAGEGEIRAADDGGTELRSGSTTREAQSVEGATETGADKGTRKIASEEGAMATVGEDWGQGTVKEEGPAERVSEEGQAERVTGEAPAEAVSEERAAESVSTEEAGEVVSGEREVEVVSEEGAGETGAEQWVREDSEARQPREGKKAGRRFFGSGWMVGVTILLLIIAGVVIYLWTRHQEFWDKTVAAMATDSGDANKGTKIEPIARDTGNTKVTGSGSKADSAMAGAGAVAASGNGGIGDSLYTKLYRPYMRGDDPVEVRVYYQDYKAGNYAAVLAGDESKVAAAGVRRLQLKNYLRFYKGLAYLATGNARDAVTEFGEVTFRTNPGDELYETARWYMALAWLKRNDADPAEVRSKVLGIVRDISHGYSRYREPAREIVRAFGS